MEIVNASAALLTQILIGVVVLWLYALTRRLAWRLAVSERRRRDPQRTPSKL